jgi:formate dehydrogenase maturation protein FdhE
MGRTSETLYMSSITQAVDSVPIAKEYFRTHCNCKCLEWREIRISCQNGEHKTDNIFLVLNFMK